MDRSEYLCESFYDAFAPVYKHIYIDWEKSTGEQAKVLDELIRHKFSGEVKYILDASCGIGTQLIGLSRLGYELTGADISEKELSIAGEELKKRDLPVDLHRCGFKDLPTCFERIFDMVIACDNSLLHLLSDREIMEAFRSIYKVCKEGILISVRDYDEIDRNIIHLVPYGYRQIDDKRMFLFQRWEFEGDFKTVSFFFIEDIHTGNSAPVTGRVHKTKFYAISTQKVMDLLKESGFTCAECIKHRYGQPVIIGKKQGW